MANRKKTIHIYILGATETIVSEQLAADNIRKGIWIKVPNYSPQNHDIAKFPWYLMMFYRIHPLLALANNVTRSHYEIQTETNRTHGH